MEPEAGKIMRVVVVCERQGEGFTQEGFTQEEFVLAPEEVDVVAPLIVAMLRERPPEEERTS